MTDFITNCCSAYISDAENIDICKNCKEKCTAVFDCKSDLESASPYAIKSLQIYWEHKQDDLDTYLHSAILFCPLSSNDDLLFLQHIIATKRILDRDSSHDNN